MRRAPRTGSYDHLSGTTAARLSPLTDVCIGSATTVGSPLRDHALTRATNITPGAPSELSIRKVRHTTPVRAHLHDAHNIDCQ